MALPHKRLSLRRTHRRPSYDRRLRLTLWALSAPAFALAVCLLLYLRAGAPAFVSILVLLALLWVLLQSWITEHIVRPLQTLSNVVAAMREGDYTFRARGGRRGDSFGDLALEINALADELQEERASSMESIALVRRVLASIDAPVFAFDDAGFLRLLNPAGARLLGHTSSQSPLGRHARELGLLHLLDVADEEVTAIEDGEGTAQWMVRRSRFREGGVPHLLLLLSDVSLALRQEERKAWQRLIRVLGHEINNSLTPIKSLAGSLRGMAAAGAPPAEFEHPLSVIEERAESLHRFLAAYRTLAQLPPPRRERFPLQEVLQRLASLEVRVPVEVLPGPDLLLYADKDQFAQAVLNLLRNAAEAALENPARTPHVELGWKMARNRVIVRVEDSGLGIANPGSLFVPFYTTKQQGTGIGLALVRQIAEAHDGSVSLRSGPNGGAIAEFRLPI